MNSKLQIVRTDPRRGGDEHPVLTSKGYELGDPRFSNKKHHTKNAVYVATLDEAAALIERGFSIRMGGPGKRPSLVAPKSVKITR